MPLHPFRRLPGPEEMPVDLPGPQQVLQLLEAREAAKLERLPAHVDAPEDLVQLPRAAPCVPVAAKLRKRSVDLVERDPVAAIVGARFPEAGAAAGEGLGDDLGDLPDPVVLLGGADVEDLIVD